MELAFGPDALEVSVAQPAAPRPATPAPPAAATASSACASARRCSAAASRRAPRDGRFELHARLPFADGRHDRPRVRVLIVDDDDLMRAGLRGVLASDEAIELVGEADDGREAAYRTRLLEARRGR